MLPCVSKSLTLVGMSEPLSKGANDIKFGRLEVLRLGSAIQCFDGVNLKMGRTSEYNKNNNTNHHQISIVLHSCFCSSH